jgi:hypothetical protein
LSKTEAPRALAGVAFPPPINQDDKITPPTNQDDKITQTSTSAHDGHGEKILVDIAMASFMVCYGWYDKAPALFAQWL